MSVQMRGGPEPLMVTGWVQIMSLGMDTHTYDVRKILVFLQPPYYRVIHTVCYMGWVDLDL